nr:MAG TPA: putative head morphogenesis protein [Caudoviricetes sp.]
MLSEQLRGVLTAHGIQLDTDLAALVRAAESDARALIAAQLPAGVSIAFNQVAAQQTAWIVNRATQQVTTRHYMLQAEDTEAMKRELVRSIPIGANPRETARRVIKAVQGVFNGGLHRARVIARTEQIDAYRAAAAATHQANRHMLKGWQWVAALSERTCRSCLAMHGTLHPLNEPGPLDHQQGRCTRVPVTKSWKELGFQGDEPPGRVSPGDGEKWLRNQPRKVQEHILGVDGLVQWETGNWPSVQWSELRTTGGWRDSYGAAKPPKAGPGWEGEKLPPPAFGQTLTPKDDAWGHWRARQAALRGPVARGRLLEPREIVFGENIEALGMDLPWLPLGGKMRGKVLPSNDILWPITGNALEHKTVSVLHHSNAKAAIRKDRAAAFKNHGVDKNRYLIDFGDREVDLYTLKKLSEYAPPVPLAELWVYGAGRYVRVI